MLNYDICRNWDFGNIVHRYDAKDAKLYALSLGYGSDPCDENELRFVYEQDLQVVPTMTTVLGTPGFWQLDPRTGIDAGKAVHGEQELRLFQPLPLQGELSARCRVLSVTDKGAGKGAIMVTARELVDMATDATLAEVRVTSFLRGDGGYSAQGAPSDPPPAALARAPERDPDVSVTLATLPQSALIYRLNGDENPLHASPEVARKAGFPGPILHGLCTYGMAGRAAIRVIAGNDPTRLRRLAARFTAPVYPGEAIRFDFWRLASDRFSLRARVVGRDAVVLDNGIVEIA